MTKNGFLSIKVYKKQKKIINITLKLQSNLCTTATVGTQKNWPLFKSGCYSKVVVIQRLEIDVFAGLAAVDSFPLFKGGR
jgi:hypothetical protein